MFRIRTCQHHWHSDSVDNCQGHCVCTYNLCVVIGRDNNVRTSFYQLRQLRPVTWALASLAAKALVHAIISCRLDYCNSLLYGVSDYTFCEKCFTGYQSTVESSSRLPVWFIRHCWAKHRGIYLMLRRLSGLDRCLTGCALYRPIPRTHNTFGDRSFAASEC